MGHGGRLERVPGHMTLAHEHLVVVGLLPGERGWYPELVSPSNDWRRRERRSIPQMSVMPANNALERTGLRPAAQRGAVRSLKKHYG